MPTVDARGDGPAAVAHFRSGAHVPRPPVGATATLGPTGTSSEAAARFFAESTGDPGANPIRLFPSYELASAAVLSGEAERLLVANAYSEVNTFYMDSRLDLEQAFVFETPVYGLAARSDAPLPLSCRIATHPAPRALIGQLLPPGYQVSEVILATSTSAAAARAAAGEFDLALTTAPAARRHELCFISRTRPIRMLWSVFGRAAATGADPR